MNLTAKEKKAVAEIEANIPKHAETCTKIVDMSSTGNVKTEDIYKYFSDNKSTLDGFRSQVNTLLKDYVKATDNTYKRTQSTNNHSIITFLVILSAAIILGVLLTFAIVKPIIISLSAATNYLNIIATGDFSKDISPNLLSSKDEVGIMLRAVDKMKKSIKEVLASVIAESHNIKKMIETTNSNMSNLSVEIQDVYATTEELSAGMEETSASTQEMNAASQEIQNAIENIALKAQESAKSSDEVSARANEVKLKGLESQKVQMKFIWKLIKT